MTLTDRRAAVTPIPSLADLDGGVEHGCCTARGRDDLLPGSIGQKSRYTGDSAARRGQAGSGPGNCGVPWNWGYAAA